MGFLPSRVTPKQWAMVGVSVAAIGAAGYLIFNNTRDQGQAVSNSGTPAQAVSSAAPSGTAPSASAPGVTGSAPGSSTPTAGGDTSKPVRMVPGPQKIAPK
jgi:hypothetical protein